MRGVEIIEKTRSHANIGVIIVAAGSSTRMSGIDKMFIPLHGQPLISYSLNVFHDLPMVHSIVLCMSRTNVEQGRRLVESNGWNKVARVTLGGDRRQDSVRNGLEHIDDVDWVIVHDGARPFASSEMIIRGIEEAEHTGAAVAAVPVKDTIKVIGDDNIVVDTPDRNRLWASQTPQIFRRELLARAHESVSEDVTDDAAMVERIGGKVRLFMGSYENIKVTTAEDVAIAEAILASRNSTRAQPIP